MNPPQDPHLVTSSLEILAILRSIEQSKALLRMQVEGRPMAFVTTILGVHASEGSLTVDNSADDDFNERIFKAEHVLFETNLEKIRVSFTAQQIQPCLYENRPAFQLPIPQTLRRVQRREYYRVDTPVSAPALCTLTRAVNGQPEKITLPVKDISAGGLSLLDPEHLLSDKAGALYKDCMIELPDTGKIVASLRIARVQDMALPNGEKTRLLGCGFVNLPNAMQILVQHYIGQLERKLNAKRRGYE
jgi:c-di-GMP-binding flagellar brake protein YcgR